MNKEDRDFIIKIAKRQDDIDARVKKLEEKKTEQELPKKPDVAPMPISSQASPNEPVCIITTTFKMDKIMSAQQSHDELRKRIIDFCREAGIQELAVNFKEKQ